MIVFEYDIWDSDKGIIIAENKQRAIEIFRKEYGNATEVPIKDVDVDDYDSGVCVINLLCDSNVEGLTVIE